MRDNLENIQHIDNYLMGILSEEDHALFEKEMAADETLKVQVANQRLVLQAIKRKYLRMDIKKARGSSGSKLFWKIGGLIVLFAIVSIILLTKNSIAPEEIEDQSFNGLKTWVEPDIQHFDFHTKEGATIEGKNGILIIVPEDAFLDTAGQIVNGNVDFELIEALSLSDMILYNLTTQADSLPLETGGMFYTNATCQGQALSINPQRPLYIEIPTDEVKKGMMAFKGEVSKEGNINWKDPLALKKFLVRINFEELDFLPDCFEQKIKEEGKDSPFYLENKSRIDSLYYTISFNINTDAQTEKDTIPEYCTYTIVTSDPKTGWRSNPREIVVLNQSNLNKVDPTFTSSIVEKTPSCGIDPLTVYSIKTSEFTNTFMATNEFEKRIKVLHRSTSGEALVQLYINNLSKPMHAVDAMVAKKLSGYYKKAFRDFETQKCTNLEDAAIYQDRLSDYYNKKKAAKRKATENAKKELAKMDKNQLDSLQNELKNLRKQAALIYDKQASEEINNNIVRNITARNVATSNTYATPWYSFGWANIDRYLKYLNGENKKVEIVVNNAYPDIKTYQWLNLINTLTPISMKGNIGTALFPKEGKKGSDKMANTHAIAVSREGDQFAWSGIQYNPYHGDTIVMNLSAISLADLKKNLAAMDIKTNPLIERLRTTEELLTEAIEERKRQGKNRVYQKKKLDEKEEFIQLQTNEKQKEITRKQLELNAKQEFEHELKKICFPCIEELSDLDEDRPGESVDGYETQTTGITY